jgi:hypothetical protein
MSINIPLLASLLVLSQFDVVAARRCWQFVCLFVLSWVLWVSVMLHRFLCAFCVHCGAWNGHGDAWSWFMIDFSPGDSPLASLFFVTFEGYGQPCLSSAGSLRVVCHEQ